MTDFTSIEKDVLVGKRITSEQAHWLWHNATLAEMQVLAQSVRARFHRPDAATYLLMRIINYTNVCVAKCALG